jgi:hypothetical protein
MRVILCAVMATAVSCAGAEAKTIVIPKGTTSGPIVVNNPTAPPTTGVTNHGTINGGSSPGITITGPTPVTVVNTGSITSSTQGITISGSSSSVTNTGTIVVTSTSTGKSSSVGISQGSP